MGEEEHNDHLFLRCGVASNLWSWLSEVMNFNFTNFNIAAEIVRWGYRQNKKMHLGSSVYW